MEVILCICVMGYSQAMRRTCEGRLPDKPPRGPPVEQGRGPGRSGAGAVPRVKRTVQALAPSGGVLTGSDPRMGARNQPSPPSLPSRDWFSRRAPAMTTTIAKVSSWNGGQHSPPSLTGPRPGAAALTSLNRMWCAFNEAVLASRPGARCHRHWRSRGYLERCCRARRNRPLRQTSPLHRRRPGDSPPPLFR